MKEFTESATNISTPEPECKNAAHGMVGSTLSRPLSLLHGLKWMNYEINDTLTIHVVGSTFPDTMDLVPWEIIPHIYTNIKKLHISFVGPENFPVNKNKVCKLCKKVMTIDVSSELYHDYVKSKKYRKPDVICAFNCGFNDYPTWAPSIPFLIDAPFIMTSFCDTEADDDIKVILNANPHIDFKRKVNPFSNKEIQPRRRDLEIGVSNRILTVFFKLSDGNKETTK